jgi:signal peptidase I
VTALLPARPVAIPAAANGSGKRDPLSTSTQDQGGWWETVKIIFQALLIALVIRTFFFQPFNIPSGSLIPTLLIGDYLFVSKYSYGYSRHSFPFSVKRVIGLPGDRSQMIQGVLHINGSAVREERIGEQPVDLGAGYRGRAVAYWETLPGGTRHQIHKLNDGRGLYNNTNVYQVPANNYFMMGDNRDNSTDSRDDSVGYVPFVNFVGRAEIIFFSIDERSAAWQLWNWPWAVRWGRLFSRVR